MEKQKSQGLIFNNNVYPDKPATIELVVFRVHMLNHGSYTEFRNIVEQNQLMYEQSDLDSLKDLAGSRTYCWKVFLGLIPNNIDMV